jgi:hypothetical protein
MDLAGSIFGSFWSPVEISEGHAYTESVCIMEIGSKVHAIASWL